ncbi:MAG: hypothetical protein KDD25_07810, partial [Bdellovibrionales bacterium]|nr:hypothetical protein [Bdellovibrionales bacterium]
AYISGAWGWSKSKRVAYANFLESGENVREPFYDEDGEIIQFPHLISVSATENRKKGDKSPVDYMPPNKKIKCAYLVSWVRVKRDWDLDIEPESDFVEKNLKSCR